MNDTPLRRLQNEAGALLPGALCRGAQMDFLTRAEATCQRGLDVVSAQYDAMYDKLRNLATLLLGGAPAAATLWLHARATLGPMGDGLLVMALGWLAVAAMVTLGMQSRTVLYPAGYTDLDDDFRAKGGNWAQPDAQESQDALWRWRSARLGAIENETNAMHAALAKRARALNLGLVGAVAAPLAGALVAVARAAGV